MALSDFIGRKRRNGLTDTARWREDPVFDSSASAAVADVVEDQQARTDNVVTSLRDHQRDQERRAQPDTARPRPVRKVARRAEEVHEAAPEKVHAFTPAVSKRRDPAPAPQPKQTSDDVDRQPAQRVVEPHEPSTQLPVRRSETPPAHHETAVQGVGDASDLTARLADLERTVADLAAQNEELRNQVKGVRVMERHLQRLMEQVNGGGMAGPSPAPQVAGPRDSGRPKNRPRKGLIAALFNR